MEEYYGILHGIFNYFNHVQTRDWISEFIPEKYPGNRFKHLKKIQMKIKEEIALLMQIFLLKIYRIIKLRNSQVQMEQKN